MMFTHKTMKQYRETAGIAALAVGLSACAATPALPASDTAPTANLVEAVTYEYPFRDPSLSTEARAADLVSRLTLEEKAAQMYDKAAPVERLGIRKHNWWNEALHGVARAGEATVFPQAIGLAATWDEDLMLEVATAISDEGRAKHNNFARQGVYEMYTDLTYWSPNINIFRDPRWGRGQETYGEDPFLTGRMATNFVNGIQGDDDKYLKAVATVKHFAVHSGPEPTRHSDDYNPTEADLHETYLGAFKAAFDNTQVASVMCAYNAYRGAPACGSEELMVDILRGELGFKGYVVSDCGAIGDFYYDHAHKYVKTRAEAAALSVKMGTDINCGDGEGNKMDALPEAVALGLIDEATIDQAVTRLFTARFRLGEFDTGVPYADIPYSVVASEQNLALSAKAARDSLVLLKNDGILPLAEGTKVAVIGPNADNELTLVANYFGYPTAPVTALEGVIAKAGAENVVYAPGAALAGNVFGNKKPVEASVFKHADENGDLQPGLTMTSWDNASRDGDPVSVTVDAQIDHHWKTSPINGEIADEFVIVWTGFIVPETDGAYSFGVPRMSEATVDGKKITDGPIEMKAGEAYPVEYTLNAVRAWPVNTIEPTAKLSWVNTSRDWAGEALDVAKDADVVLFFGGIDADLEGEEMSVEIDGFLGGDRTHLKLPQVQEDLLKQLHATGKPVVLVNFSGSAVALNWEAENLPAIVQAFYPGEKAGTAIADLLWGEFSPSGRLPVTFYTSLDGMPAFDDYSMQNRTYKYYEGKPLYPFGYGLSYTTFAYSDISVPEAQDGAAAMPVSVTVTNTGERAGREVVQAYIQLDERPNPSTPRVELVAFDVVELAPGESQTVTFDLSPERLGYFDEDGALVAPAGMSATLSLGGGQPGFVEDTGAASARVTFNAD